MSSNSLPNQQQQFDDVVLTIPDNRSPEEKQLDLRGQIEQSMSNNKEYTERKCMACRFLVAGRKGLISRSLSIREERGKSIDDLI